jgi:hypothetical protein
VVLIAIMREGATAARMRQLSALVGVSRRTVERWRGVRPVTDVLEARERHTG